ncbi:redoxin domain-containing protein [Lutibacter sp.]|uniref:redoxin domain-containing protein n=1 Tax=Lutibacter sp. TaxID=1925666 RepID=UPI0035675637
MRNFLILISVLFFIIFTSCTENNNKSFSISGKVSNLKENYVVLSLIDDFQNNTSTIIDTLEINKKGEFNSVYFLEPAIYSLNFDNEKTILLAIDKGQHLKIQGSTIENILVKGSVDTDLLNAYEDFRVESLNRLVKSVRNKITASQNTASEQTIAELRELEVENYKKHISELTTFIKEKMGTSIAIYPTSIRWNGEENLPFYKELTNAFEEKHPTIEITKKIKERLQLLEKTSVGSVVSNIKMTDSSGEIIELDSIRKKYTLIDFWASWCPPCRTESSLLNELYANYNSKGFEIYGISLDSKAESWTNALEKDQRIWPNVSTVEGFKTPVSIAYGITALPTNFLIDETGKIIATNVHGKLLKAKIDALFTE